MEISERIQWLRKQKGISQEELAYQVGVSRQAVSKWESGQSLPDVEKLLALSEYFQISTDELLKGEVYVKGKTSQRAQAFFVLSVFFCGAGLLYALGSWFEYQLAQNIVVGMVVQGVGGVFYFVGKLLWQNTPSFGISYANVLLVALMPTAICCNLVFGGMMVAPYPLSIGSAVAWIVIYGMVAAMSYRYLHKEK